MSKRAIGTIIFDAGGVLFYIKEFRSSIIQRVLSAMGYDEANVQKANEIGKYFDREYFAKYPDINNWEDEKKWMTERANAIAEAVDSDSPVLADKLKYLTLDTFQYELYDETVATLSRLKQTHELAVLSNANASLDWAFDYLGIRQYFTDVIISSYEGCVKPDSKLYEITLKRLGKTAEQCVFIDDRLENVEAAKALGMEGFHIQREIGMTLANFEQFIEEL